MEVSRVSGFLEFHQKGVTGGLQKAGGGGGGRTEHGKSRGCKTRNEVV